VGETQTDIRTDRYTTDRQIHTQTDRQIHTQRDIWTDTRTDRYTPRQTYGQTDTHTDIHPFIVRIMEYIVNTSSRFLFLEPIVILPSAHAYFSCLGYSIHLGSARLRVRSLSYHRVHKGARWHTLASDLHFRSEKYFWWAVKPVPTQSVLLCVGPGRWFVYSKIILSLCCL
jgi:hypothetical protein